MKRIIFAILLIVPCLMFAQTGTVINDLTNFSYERTAFQNALTGDGCGIGSFTTTGTRDTVVIKGVKYSSMIITSARGESAGAVDSTVVTWSFLNETTPVDTVIFARNMTRPTGGKFTWWVIKW